VSGIFLILFKKPNIMERKKMRQFFLKMFKSNNDIDLTTIHHAGEKTRGGSGNATEFGRPQGKKPGT
jgi:hypothetical protein